PVPRALSAVGGCQVAGESGCRGVRLAAESGWKAPPGVPAGARGWGTPAAHVSPSVLLGAVAVRRAVMRLLAGLQEALEPHQVLVQLRLGIDAEQFREGVSQDSGGGP